MSSADQSTTAASAPTAPSVNESAQPNPHPKVVDTEKLKEMRDEVIAKYEQTQANLKRNTEAKDKASDHI